MKKTDLRNHYEDVPTTIRNSLKMLFSHPKILIFSIVVLMLVSGCAGFEIREGMIPKPEPVTMTEKGFDAKLPGEREMKTVTVDEVQVKLLEIGELSSYEGEYQVHKGEDYPRHILGDIEVPGTTNHIEFNCTGIVKVGYDLEKVLTEVDETSKTIYVTLPPIKINSNELLMNEDMSYEETNNIFHPIKGEQLLLLIEDMKEEGLQQALDDGLYDKAEENAEKLITNFLGCFQDYKVEYITQKMA